MTDFERNLTIRIEKAASRTLADKLNAVDWDKVPVGKMVRGTLLILLAWKFGVPAAMACLRIIQFFFVALACLCLLSLCRFMITPHDGTDVPAPRAELINPYPHHW